MESKILNFNPGNITYRRPILGGFHNQPRFTSRPAAAGPRPAASRASKRQLCVLAALSGILQLALARASAPELRQLIAAADQQAQQAIKSWAVTGDERQHLLFAAAALTSWDAQITDAELTITGSLALALHLLTDLEDLVGHRDNKTRILQLFAPIQAAYDWLDRAGVNWPAIEWAEQLAAKLYQIVGEE